MFRKLLSGLTSTAVVAGLATAGAVAVAAPAAAVDTFNIPPYKDSQNNPTLASQCGLDFGLVLDASGSIGDTGIANLKTAADAFVDALFNAATVGQTYELVGPKTYTLRELVDYTAELSGSKAHIIALSEGWAYLQAGLAWLAPSPVLSPDNLRSMQVDSVADNANLAPANWRPTALESIAPSYVGRSTPKGKLDSFRFRAGR